MGTQVIDSLRPYWHAKSHFCKGVVLEEVANSAITLHSSSYMSKQGEYINGTNVSTISIPDFPAGAPINVFMRVMLTEKDGAANITIAHKISTAAQEGFSFRLDSSNRISTSQYCTDASSVTNSVGSAVLAKYGTFMTYSFQARSNNINGVQCFIDGIRVGVDGSTVGKTIRHRATVGFRILGYASGQNLRGIVSDIVIFQGVELTELQHAQISSELNSISYPTAVYEIRPPDYPTIKDGTPSFALCCGETTDKAGGVTPTTATAVQRKKDTQMADYLQFTRTSSSKLDYGIQTQNQLNYEFEWDGDVYFDTDAVGQVAEIVKIGDSATGVCWGLRKTATEKFQFIYGNESTVDFAYAVPSLGPLHIVLRREWVSGTTYDVKLWVNGSYKEKVTGTYAGTGNASAKTYIGYSGNITNTNYLSGRIYYSNIYSHLRPVGKFQRDPFSKTLMLGWGIRANNTVNTVERDTDSVVRVVSGGATFKVNSGFGVDARLEKFLETTAAGATFYLRGIDNADGLTLYYRTTGTLAWTEGDGTVGVTVAADGLFTMPATTQLLWGTLGGTGGIVKENR